MPVFSDIASVNSRMCRMMSSPILLYFGILAVMVAVQRDQRFGQPDEADRQGAVLEHFADLVVRT